jgi:NAD(P)-dependent dehydrogenase (short-subunit alcohol dehydrogenase family)
MGGLGEAISMKLHDTDHAVVVTYSPTNAGADDWLARTESQGYMFRAYPVDVADYDSCQHCAARIQAEVGPVDILVNNAGVTRDTTLKKMDKVNWDAVIRTNLDSLFNMTKPGERRGLHCRQGTGAGIATEAGQHPGKGGGIRWRQMSVHADSRSRPRGTKPRRDRHAPLARMSTSGGGAH